MRFVPWNLHRWSNRNMPLISILLPCLWFATDTCDMPLPFLSEFHNFSSLCRYALAPHIQGQQNKDTCVFIPWGNGDMAAFRPFSVRNNQGSVRWTMTVQKTATCQQYLPILPLSLMPWAIIGYFCVKKKKLYGRHHPLFATANAPICR